MSAPESTGTARVEVENVGGIESTAVDLAPGVTVLEGRNATNRTSLLSAVAAALGSDQATLRGDADEGWVRLDLDDETYGRTFTRTGTTVQTGGDPYLTGEDAVAADRFAAIMGSNEARRAVERGDDLREVIMGPVDTAALRAEIEDLHDERDRIDAELETIDDLADRLPELEQRRHDLDEAIEKQRDRLAAKRSEIESLNADPDAERERRDDLEAAVTDLNDARSELGDVQRRIEAEEESLDSLRAERDERQADLADLPDPEQERIDRLETDLSRLREQRRSLSSTVSRLDEIIEFNAAMVDGDGPPVAGLADGGEVTDALLAEDERSVVCWTCGTEVERSAVDGTQAQLRDLRDELVADREDVAARIQEVSDDLDRLRERRERRQQVQADLDRLATEIETREATLADLHEREAALEDRTADLEERIAALREDTGGEALERYREASEIERELGRLEGERDDVVAEIEEVESRLAGRDDLERRREQVQEELVDRRTRVETIEREAVEAFNDHVAALLSRLDYENVERVWIEATGSEATDDRRFDLHVVRAGADGVYEDSVDTLSESERAVVGLVFALAGYLAHDLQETVPFLLLDSLEAIDADRIGTLVDYFADHATYLLVALLPEDAEAVDADHRVTEI